MQAERPGGRAWARGRVAVAAVAAAVAALSGCQKGTEPAVAHTAMADTADQTMFGARSLLTDRGLLRAELLSDTAYFFDDNTRIELRNVHVTFYAANGAKNAVLTSREGTYNTRANQMEARGNVVVVSEDGRRLVSPQLRFNQTANQISSDSAFTLTEPGRSVSGIGFVSDPDMNNIRILKTTTGTGSAVIIPNQ